MRLLLFEISFEAELFCFTGDYSLELECIEEEPNELLDILPAKSAFFFAGGGDIELRFAPLTVLTRFRYC